MDANSQTDLPSSDSNPIDDIAPPTDNGRMDMGESPFDIQKLQQLKSEREEKTTKVKKTRKLKGLTATEKTQIFGPFFLFVNVILGKFEIDELDKNEIDTGIEAWSPIADRYLPALDKYGIWIPPALWTSGVIMLRLESQNKKAIALTEALEKKESAPINQGKET